MRVSMGEHLPPDDPRHGTRTAYDFHQCRCAECKAVAAKYRRELRARVVVLAPDDPRHGTENGYGNLRCRCTKCTQAHARICRAKGRARALKRALAIAKKQPSPVAFEHGTRNGYDYHGCRCLPCTMAKRGYQQAWRARQRALASARVEGHADRDQGKQ